jgi:hypothetical protein
VKDAATDQVAVSLGLQADAPGLVAWDVFEAVLTPGDVILLMTSRDQKTAEALERGISPNDGARLRQVRILRDYGMYDRREAPQYYADIERR